MYRMFYLGGNFMSSLICTLKSKKPKKTLKNLKTFSKKPRFFPALVTGQTQLIQTSETGNRQADAQYVATCDRVPSTNHKQLKQYTTYCGNLLTTISQTKQYIPCKLWQGKTGDSLTCQDRESLPCR